MMNRQELTKKWNETDAAYWELIEKAKKCDPYRSASNGLKYDRLMDKALKLEAWLNKNHPGI